LFELDPPPPKPPGRSRKIVLCLSCGATGIFNPVGPNKVPAWLCQHYPACDSYVGVHPGTENALGTMANAELRSERVKAHGWIDRIWRGKMTPTRKEVYQLISQSIGVRHFHVAQCDQALLVKLSARRADIERAFVGLAPATGPAPIVSAGPPLITPNHSLTREIVSDMGQSPLDALFGDLTRRLWPTDPGGRAAAKLCVQMGSAQSHLDIAGKRWISKVR
jgi:hypothetical protein